MHRDILTKKQQNLLPLFKKFPNFGLVGGTAIALQIGHRRSIDFDMFSLKQFKNTDIRDMILKTHTIDKELVDRPGEFTFLINDVKATFFYYRLKIDFPLIFDDIFKIPKMSTLAVMKLHALGQRAKWKDYVDLYFILKNHLSVQEICDAAPKILGYEFNEKLFRLRLAYFYDIDYSEPVEFMSGFEVDDATIQKTLTEYSLV